MQVVILAGGRGVRLGPITKKIPKPMADVKGKPFLHYLLEYIKSFGYDNFLILVGYLGEKIEDYFGAGQTRGINIDYSYDKELLGTGGALRKSEEKLEDEFFLVNGDTFLKINYKELEKTFFERNKSAIITVYENIHFEFTNNILLDEANSILDYNKRNSDGLTHVDAGVYAFQKEILKYIPPNLKYSLEENVFQKLIKEKKLAAYISLQKFYDIGTIHGLKETEEVVK